MVSLHVYALSGGLARQQSMSFLGKAIEGIWPTNVVVYGAEYFFGAGIQQITAEASQTLESLKSIREEAYAFACAMLIQIQKAMMELNQILRANEINFVILAALPTFFLSLEVLMLLHASVKQEKKRSSSLQATDGAT
ncbi:hypothetical protein L2E82_02198 [Cichorium intybus]|uniref:Uncharacterized protein n=1 Tax=Cichorium intybus TaxID=13427 RepID=A0ACB9H1T1_CICIN|nr:hypothetical protein L2E82_51322 [Cichorium intybus]KAI3789403.1 hypothetical protein L2E82_02198 [Cichorium intybus]